VKYDTAFRPSILDHIEIETEESQAQAPGETAPSPVPQALEDLSTEELRMLASETGYSVRGWNTWTRDMLLALLNNRKLRRASDAAYHE